MRMEDILYFVFLRRQDQSIVGSREWVELRRPDAHPIRPVICDRKVRAPRLRGAS
jgi:hypothetical protein